MPNEQHALLGPSSAERWLHCPPSARLTENMPDPGSEYADSGTLAHSVAELKARAYFLEPMSKRTFNSRLKKLTSSEHYDKSLDDATDMYLDHLKARALAYETAPVVVLETRVDFSDYVPEGFGRLDCGMAGGDLIDIVDYKNGSGVDVSAEENPQMMLYAWGLYKSLYMFFGDTIKRVHISIVQPHSGGIKEWETTIAEIKAWLESYVAPRAKLAWAGEGEYDSGDWCRFCKAKATCAQRAKALFDVEPMLGGKPEISASVMDEPGTIYLTNEQIGQILTRAKDVAKWLKDLEDYALKTTLLGVEIPGWKAVEGRGSREWVGSTDEAFEKLKANGIPEAVLYERKPVSVAGLEKALGKKEFNAIAENLWVKTPGKPTLAPASDKRPVYNPAAAAFTAVEE